MAGDWIKMRVDLHTHPKVVRIVSAVCPQDVRKVSARCLIVGALHAMWSLFDAHSTDGQLHGYSPETLDVCVGIDGFTVAVESVGWVVVSDKCLEMPEFGTHNGKGAKRRAEDTAAKRVRRMSAECPQDDRTDCGPEKRREEKIYKPPIVPQGDGVGAPAPKPEKKPPKLIPEYSPAFLAFWNAYPTVRRQDKQKCWKRWQADFLDREKQAGLVMENLRRWKRCDQWTKDGGQYVCNPHRWLLNRMYAEEPPTGPTKETHE
jgi:hypothetical protein